MRILVRAADAAVGIDGDVIAPPEGRFDVVLDIPESAIRPGLINAHDHLHRNHYGPLGRVDGEPRYANAYEWGDEIHRRDAGRIAAARAVDRRDALLLGAWKNLFAGVTTVVHHDAWDTTLAGDFPIRVAPLRCAHSLRLGPPPTEWAGDKRQSFAIHLAEGTDAAAAEEVREMDALGLLRANLIAVHAVGADPDGIDRLRRAGAAVAWCPTSNMALLGATASASLLAEGIDVLLGSDSLLSGAGDLLDELRFARSLGLIADERLELAVGRVAARRIGVAAPTLEIGARADLVVLRRRLLQARAADVAAVFVAGVPRVVDVDASRGLAPAFSGGAVREWNGLRRWTLGAWPNLMPAAAPLAGAHAG